MPPCAPSPPLSSLPLPGIETFTVSAVSEASPAPFQLATPRQNTDTGYLCPLLPCWPAGDNIHYSHQKIISIVTKKYLDATPDHETDPGPGPAILGTLQPIKPELLRDAGGGGAAVTLVKHELPLSLASSLSSPLASPDLTLTTLASGRRLGPLPPPPPPTKSGI